MAFNLWTAPHSPAFKTPTDWFVLPHNMKTNHLTPWKANSLSVACDVYNHFILIIKGRGHRMLSLSHTFLPLGYRVILPALIILPFDMILNRLVKNDLIKRITICTWSRCAGSAYRRCHWHIRALLICYSDEYRDMKWI